MIFAYNPQKGLQFMSLKFSKWTGLGNDFVLVEPGESFDMTPGQLLKKELLTFAIDVLALVLTVLSL